MAGSPRDDFYFPGFAAPNLTPVPDDFFDLLAPNLSEAELRVLIYILRRTFGFKKERDAISLSQMVSGIRTKDGRTLDLGTGMSRRGVMKGCAGLVEKGIIEVDKRLSDEKDHETNVYSLRFRPAAAGAAEVGNVVSYRRAPRSPGVGNQDHQGRAPRSLRVGNNVPPQHDRSQHDSLQVTELQQQPEPAGDTSSAPVVVVSEKPEEAPEKNALLTRLLECGVTRKTALELLDQHPTSAVHEQLEVLPYRKADEPAAILVQAIRESWAAPKKFTRQKARHEREKQEVAARQEASREEAAEQAQVVSYLDSLSDVERSAIETQAMERYRRVRSGSSVDEFRRSRLREGFILSVARERLGIGHGRREEACR